MSTTTPVVAVYHGRKNISCAKVSAALTQLAIPHAPIGAAAIAAGRLDRFACVVFPGGHSIQIGRAGERRLQAWLKRGGGFVGICAGCQFGARLQLLPVRHVILRATGIFDLRVVLRHPVTAGYSVAGRHRNRATWQYSPAGRVRMRYANGGQILPTGAGTRVLVSFDEPGGCGAVVAGACGRGRVVLISPHPESTPPSPPAALADSDACQDPLRLFGNAVCYAARIALPPHQR